MKLTYTNVVVVERINETDNSIDLTPPGPTNGMIWEETVLSWPETNIALFQLAGDFKWTHQLQHS